MEKLFTKLARQLDAIDEASLMSLWSKYATLTSRFEPTKRWEEAALIFSLIQAKRWKNQLFNYYWSRQSRLRQAPRPDNGQAAAPQALAPEFGLEGPQDAPERPVVSPRRKPCRVLAFKPAATPDTATAQKKDNSAPRKNASDPSDAPAPRED